MCAWNQLMGLIHQIGADWSCLEKTILTANLLTFGRGPWAFTFVIDCWFSWAAGYTAPPLWFRTSLSLDGWGCMKMRVVRIQLRACTRWCGTSAGDVETWNQRNRKALGNLRAVAYFLDELRSRSDSSTHVIKTLRMGRSIINVGSWLVNGTSIMLNFSKFIQTPLFEKWYLYNANFLGALNF